MHIDDKVEQRFWSLVTRGQRDQCWRWHGGTTFRVGRANCFPRTVAVTIAARHKRREAIPAKVRVEPTCGNENCVNPEHMRIMRSWSRHSPVHKPQALDQSLSPLNPLEEQRVRQRHAAGASVRELARELNIPVKSVARILKAAP